MALFPASHVVVVGGGLAGMVVANQVDPSMAQRSTLSKARGQANDVCLVGTC